MDRNGGLTESEIDAIAERVANKAFEKFAARVGNSVINKVLWLATAVVIGIASWLAGKGLLKL